LNVEQEEGPMVSTVSPRQAEVSDDLYVVESPSLHERLNESRYSDRPPLASRPSFARRASRASLRFLIACGIGVAGTLAWQAYGDEAKQTIATFGEQHGVPMAWLSSAEPATPTSQTRAEAAETAPARPPGPEIASELQQLKTMTLGLGSTLGAVKERIEQLATAQQQTASDVAKLQAAEQEIRQKLSTASARPAPAAPSKQQTPAAPRALTPH
jgi:hypothetical protein